MKHPMFISSSRADIFDVLCSTNNMLALQTVALCNRAPRDELELLHYLKETCLVP